MDDWVPEISYDRDDLWPFSSEEKPKQAEIYQDAEKGFRSPLKFCH